MAGTLQDVCEVLAGKTYYARLVLDRAVCVAGTTLECPEREMKTYGENRAPLLASVKGLGPYLKANTVVSVSSRLWGCCGLKNQHVVAVLSGPLK